MTGSEGYAIPAASVRTEDVILGSRFIASLGHAPDPPAARAFLDAVRAEFPDATHNCWAYVTGPPGSTASIGMSDAGEPHGTAGRPMLDVLLHSGVGEIVAVVTRYFGGTKLGTGGLVRAYGGAVQHALAELATVRKVARVTLQVAVGYADVARLRRLLEQVGAEVLEETFAEAVHCRAAVPLAAGERCEAGVADISGGKASVSRA
ncbi:MAG: YigZ family protein [Gemmatimonadetes bacterium]|nr:YigZ family protein [Gemmatimonadota bacterium]